MTNDQNINDISHLTLSKHVKSISLQFTKYLTYTYVGKLTTTADQLSGEGLDRDPGILHIQQVVEGTSTISTLDM